MRTWALQISNDSKRGRKRAKTADSPVAHFLLHSIVLFTRRRSWKKRTVHDWIFNELISVLKNSLIGGKNNFLTQRPYIYIYDWQLHTDEELALFEEFKDDSSPAAELVFEKWFIQELNCIGLEQRKASFLTRVGFVLVRESWSGVLSLSWAESVDSFASPSVVSPSLSGVSSLDFFAGGSTWGVSSKNTTITLVLSALNSRSLHFANAR